MIHLAIREQSRVGRDHGTMESKLRPRSKSSLSLAPVVSPVGSAMIASLELE